MVLDIVARRELDGRATNVQPTDEKLRADFLTVFKLGTLPDGVGQVARYEMSETVMAWYRELDEEFDVEWKGR